MNPLIKVWFKHLLQERKQRRSGARGAVWRNRTWPIGFESLENRVMLSAVKWSAADFELVNLENPEGEPWLSASPDGRFSLTFFESFAGPSAFTDLEERIYTAAGVEQTSIGTTFSAATTEHQPASAYLPDGRRVHVWTEEPAAGGGNLEDVFAEVRFGNNFVDVARFLVTGGAGRQHDPIVAANSNGFAVAVADDSVAGGQLILKFYNIAGTLINTVIGPNAPQTVGVGANADQFRDVEIAALANGNYAIAWDNGLNQNVFARVFSSGGVAQSAVIDVETGAPGASFPDVTALADGRFAVTYAEYTAGNVRGRIYQANGTPDGVGFAIGTGFANAVDNQLQTAALYDGRFVTVWKTTAGEIAGQVMFADGTPDGAAFIVNTNTTGDQSRPTIATLADGRFAVSWESGAGAAPETIFTTIFDPRDAGLNGSASSFNDDWFGTNFVDQVFGGTGADAIRGAGGADILYGELGNDNLNGDAGNDQLFGGSNNDILNGGTDDDTLNGGGGGDVLDGGVGGNDTAKYTNSPAGVSVNLNSGAASGGDAQGDTFTGIESLFGSSFDDTLTGNGSANTLNGAVGNDTLNGGGGGDALHGDEGDDTLIGGAGGDVLDGGVGGNDTAKYTNSPAGVSVNLASGAASGGHAQGDTFTGIESLFGSSLDDTLTGNGNANTLNGAAGSDTLNGGGGDDILLGGTGIDAMNGGPGRDRYTGGSEADRFIVSQLAHSPVGSQRDVVNDFLQVELDKIDVSLIDGMAGTGGVNGFTSFIGNAAFTAEGQIRAFQSGANTVVEFNTSGTTGAEMQILLLNVTAGTLTLSDFITASGSGPFALSSLNGTADRVTPRLATLSSQLTLSPSPRATLPSLSHAETAEPSKRSNVPTRLATPAIAATATGLKKRTAAASRPETILNATDLSGQLKSLDDLFASESPFQNHPFSA